MSDGPMVGMTLGNVLRRVAQRYGSREAIVFEGERYTFAQFNARINRLAHRLRERGIGRGDKVAILSRNCNEYLELYFACAKIGAVLVALNYRLAPAEIAFMVDQSDARLLCLEECLQSLVAPLVADLKGLGGPLVVIDGEPTLPGAVAYEELIAGSRDEEPQAQEVCAEDPVLLLYTSGTTGVPKGALLTHANVIWDSLSYLRNHEPHAGDKLLQGMPFIHVSGLHIFTMVNMFRGLPVVIMRTWDAEEACRLIQSERCTYAFFLVPMLQSLLPLPTIRRYDMSSLRMVLMAAASYSRELVCETMDKLGVDTVVFGYGLTECAPVVTVTESTAETIAKENCLGWPVWYVDVRIVDDEGDEVPVGTVGELIVRGPNVFAGYYHMEEATAEAVRDGWMYTGDLVRMDEDGCLFFVDRRKDMIKSGGENVYGTEVEMALLKANPELIEAVVLGIPDDKWGERVVACVRARPGADVSEAQVRERTRALIAGYKVPKSVVFVDELPRSSSGKIQKHILRERVAAGGGAS